MSAKTQISHLRSGIKRQITDQINPIGSRTSDVQEVWSKIGEENPEFLKIRVKGLELHLKAHLSISKMSLSYSCPISKEALKLFFVAPAKNETPYIQIQGKDIKISNGKNAYCHICPSFIEII